MDAAKLFEGIALLIELAQRGEIDPWDVQVIDVIDRYLGEFLPAQEAAPVACEADLSQSGQAFLSASMLVLFKANTLLQLQTPIEPEQSEEVLLQTEHGTGSKRLHLEQQLRRRPAALPPQKRRVTLQELIEQLQLMATQLQSQAADGPSQRKRGLHSQSRAEAANVIAQLAHQENLTEVAGELEQVLNRRSNHLPQQHWLNLEQLVQLWTQGKHSNSSLSPSTHEDLGGYSLTEVEPPQSATEASSAHRYDRVSVFWALLLLSAQSKVELLQEEFYQEIKVRTTQSAP